MPIPELRHNQLRLLANELWDGSAELAERKFRNALATIEFETDDREADKKRLEISDTYSVADKWAIGPNGCFELFGGEGDLISHSEFIGGIAVACGIEPVQSDIDTVIFEIGRNWGKNG